MVYKYIVLNYFIFAWLMCMCAFMHICTCRAHDCGCHMLTCESSVTLYLVFWEGSFTDLDLTHLASELQESSCLCLLSSEITNVGPIMPGFCMVAGGQIQVFVFAWQTFYQMSNLSSPMWPRHMRTRRTKQVIDVKCRITFKCTIL